MSSLSFASLYDASTGAGVTSGTDTTNAPATLATAQANAKNAAAAKIAAISVNLNARLNDATTLSNQASVNAKLLNSLQTFGAALHNLRDSTQTAGITATSDQAGVSILVGANAQASSNKVTVSQLAAAQVNQSAAVGTADQAAGFTNGTLTIQEGGNAAVTIGVTAGMSLNDIAQSINNAGAHVFATVVADGANFRLQVSGADTGAANSVAFSDSGANLGLADNQVQAAADLQGSANGVAFTHNTNTVAGAIDGTSLTFSSVVTDATITLSASGTAAAAAAQAFVSAYNTAVTAINSADSSQNGTGVLASLRQQMAGVIGQLGNNTTGSYAALAQVGITTNTDGTLDVDTSLLGQAAAADPSSVASLFSGNASGTNGLAYDMEQLNKTYAAPGFGIVSQNQYGLQALTYTNAQSVLRESEFVASYSAIVNADNTYYQKQLADMTEDALLVQILPTSL